MNRDEAAALVDSLGAAFLAGDLDRAIKMFATTGQIIYAGSERGEVAVGHSELRLLLAELFGRAERYSWRSDTVDVVACASGHLVLAHAMLSVTALSAVPMAENSVSDIVPYRLSGLLELEDGAWRWRSFLGCEPTLPL